MNCRREQSSFPCPLHFPNVHAITSTAHNKWKLELRSIKRVILLQKRPLLYNSSRCLSVIQTFTIHCWIDGWWEAWKLNKKRVLLIMGNHWFWWNPQCQENLFSSWVPFSTRSISHFFFRYLTVLLEYAYLRSGVTNERPSKNICSKVCTA